MFVGVWYLVLVVFFQYFVYLFILFVSLFVLPTVTLVDTFQKWLISQQPLIRKHSYLNHSYPGGWLVFILWLQSQDDLSLGWLKGAKIRNRYNQVPHLPPGHCMGNWQNPKKTPHTRRQRGQPFPNTWPQGCKNRHHNMAKTKTYNIKKNPQKKHRLRTVNKKITWGLKPVSWCQLHP